MVRREFQRLLFYYYSSTAVCPLQRGAAIYRQHAQTKTVAAVLQAKVQLIIATAGLHVIVVTVSGYCVQRAIIVSDYCAARHAKGLCCLAIPLGQLRGASSIAREPLYPSLPQHPLYGKEEYFYLQTKSLKKEH